MEKITGKRAFAEKLKRRRIKEAFRRAIEEEREKAFAPRLPYWWEDNTIGEYVQGVWEFKQ